MPMIANDTELSATREQLVKLEKALLSLRNRVYHQNPDRYRILAESYIVEIKTLRARADEYLGINLAGSDTEDLVVRLVGDSHREGKASAQTVSRTLAALQRGWQSIGEYIARRDFHVPLEYPHNQLAKNFELDVVAFSPGSFQISLNAAAVTQPNIPFESTTAAIQSLSRVIGYVADIDHNQQLFKETIPELTIQLQILQAMKEIAPSRRDTQYKVEFSGRFMGGHRFVFGPETRAAILGTLRSTQTHATEIGVIRELNLDTKSFVIRTETVALRCRYPVDLQEKVKEGLDQTVSVSGRAIIMIDGTVTILNVKEINVVNHPPAISPPQMPASDTNNPFN